METYDKGEGDGCQGDRVVNDAIRVENSEHSRLT